MQLESIKTSAIPNLVSRMISGDKLSGAIPLPRIFRPLSAAIKLPVHTVRLSGSSIHPVSAHQTLIRANVLPANRANYMPLKRWMDLIGAMSLLIAITPLLLVAALLIRRTDGPILICQTRLTRGGRPFQMFKLRTMYADAEFRTGAVWTQANDPRITPIGRLLRRTRIDELPQLINVLRGEMSLIGPRPERPEFSHDLAKRYPSFIRRLDVDAGISGLAQVSSGYCSDVENYRTKIMFDRVYVRHCSFWLDLKIGLQTIGVLLTGAGAR